METGLSEYDLRQLRQMRQKVEAAKKQTSAIPEFVSEQWSLLELLTTVPDAWKIKYRDNVNEIELIYSLAASSGRKSLLDDESRDVDQILCDLENQLSEYTVGTPLN